MEGLGLVCVYIPFTNINNYFFECFGSFDYLHAITLQLEEILQSKDQSKDPEVNLFLRDQSFDLIAHTGERLQGCNTFDYTVPEDIAYHTLFCYEQLGFDLDKDVLKIHGHLTEESDTFKLLYTYVRNINLLTEDTLNLQKLAE